MSESRRCSNRSTLPVLICRPIFQPIYNKINPADTPVLTLTLMSKTLPLSKVEDLADTRLAPKISQLPGVGLVSITGGQKPAVRVQANPTVMGSYGLNMEDLRGALIAASVNQAKGSFDGNCQSYQIGANGRRSSRSRKRLSRAASKTSLTNLAQTTGRMP
jgi:multidrug efflux pump